VDRTGRSRFARGLNASTGVRLVAAISVVVVVAWSALFVADTVDRTRRAEAVTGQTASLTTLIELRSAYMGERTAAEIVSYVNQLGISPQMVENLLGIEIGTILEDSQATVDDRMAALQRSNADGGIAVVAAGALRAAMEDGQLRPDERSEIGELDRALRQQIADEIVELESMAPSIGSDSDVVRLARVYELLSVMIDASGQRLADVNNQALNPTDIEVTGEVAVSTDRVERARVALLDRLTEIERVEWGPTVQATATPKLDAMVIELRSAESNVLTTPDGIARFGDAYDEGLEAIDRLEALVPAVSSTLTNEATRTGEEAAEEQRFAVIATATAAAITLLLGLSIGRSVRRSIRRVEQRARDLSEGQADGPPLPLRGPRDIATVAAALNDSATALSLVERQIAALADGRLTDPVLAQPSPGRLGELVQASMQRLSSALGEGERLRSQLAHQASHDALTGCLNRRAALEMVAAAAGSPERSAAMAVLFIDLDGFKGVNDEHGHGVGDGLLQRVAGRLTQVAAPTGSSVFRLGGDEFLVLAEHADSGDATELAQRLRLALTQPFVVDGIELAIGASIGVATLDADATPTTAADLIHRADVAVYAAKADGGGRVSVADVAD
jgi:diguanylate cyclase (GGDEF)-like protein